MPLRSFCLSFLIDFADFRAFTAGSMISRWKSEKIFFLSVYSLRWQATFFLIFPHKRPAKSVCLLGFTLKGNINCSFSSIFFWLTVELDLYNVYFNSNETTKTFVSTKANIRNISVHWLWKGCCLVEINRFRFKLQSVRFHIVFPST